MRYAPAAAAIALAIALLGAAALALYGPVLSFPLTSDDFQWVQLAHRAAHEPRLLLADLDTFYRPASTWTLVADHALWGFEARGFRGTNLLLHALAAVLLAAAGRRLGAGRAAALAIALVWVTSPFACEPALAVAIRFEDLLLVAWLGLVLAWPGPGRPWTRARLALACGLVALAAMSKETWVVTPLLVLALERSIRTAPARTAVRSALLAGLPVAVYLVLYFRAFPTNKGGYYDFSPAPLAKLPHMLAAFLELETPVPIAFPLDAKGLLASAAIAGAAAVSIRRGNPAATAGLALLLAPLVPTLLVPYLPSRYTAIPYAGFLLLAAGTVAALAGDDPGTPRRRVQVRVAAVALVVALLLAANAHRVRGEIADLGRVAAHTGRLLAEARAVLPSIAAERPLLVARAEAENPLRDIALAPMGLPKILYVRGRDAYGLADTAALLEWAAGREDTFVRRHDDAATRFAGAPGGVLAHTSSGFVWVNAEVADLGAEVRRFEAERRAFVVVRLERLGGAPAN